MPFARRRSRPATSGGVSTKALVDRDAPSLPKVSVDTGSGMKSSMERLGLHLGSSGDNIVAPVLTDEPDEIATAAPITAAAGTDTDPTSIRPPRLSLQFCNASDSRISTQLHTAEKVGQAEKTTEKAAAVPPAIVTTAPPRPSHDELRKKVSVQALFNRANSTLRRDSGLRNSFIHKPTSRSVGKQRGSLISHALAHGRSDSVPELPTIGNIAGGDSDSKAESPSRLAPPAYGDEATSQLAIPLDRLSDSSRSDGSDHRVYAQTTTTHTISTTTTFFKLNRRKKAVKGSLFPLLDNIPPPSDRPSLAGSPDHSTGTVTRDSTSEPVPGALSRKSESSLHRHSPTQSAILPPCSSPKESDQSGSGYSTPSGVLIPPRLPTRGRTSTVSSYAPSTERLTDGGHGTGQLPPSGRTSTSTTGRRSFGDLLSLPQRLRQNSTPQSGTPASKASSVHIPREQEQASLSYPKREDDDTPASYLARLEAAVPRSSIATILCKTGDDFSKTCLRKYMRGFSYFGESVDLAIRKMLMEVELPKETQQIDRLLTGFADRYYECNPGIFTSTEETAFVAFSILLLHSDTHNKNNKRKMTKQDYCKNTQQGPVQVSVDILDCFYDNICYTPFIHFEDEVAINSHRRSIPRPKKSLIRSKSSEKLRGPVDPYILILDNKLDSLRPSLKDVMDTEDTYKHCGTAPGFDCQALHTAFARSAILQIVSARSRPDAFRHQDTIANPAEAQAGLVSFKVAKVGLLWRKDPKKKKAQRAWQEWGAILTDSKLYFFKDVGWTKRLISQYDNHAKIQPDHTKAPLVFKPPLQSFTADAWMSMDDSVALVDTSYKRHKNAFVFIKHGGFEEIFLANSESDMNDWIGKLNYAATFRTAGLRMRGSVTDIKQLRRNSDISTQSADTPTKKSSSNSNSNSNSSNNSESEWEIAYYRRQLISEKISDLEERIGATQKELDHLLRNARHLLVLLPIQVKTREAIILAAGRMSAKLKWTRVELWRAKTHQEILTKDLEQESPSDFPVPIPARISSMPKGSSVKSPQSLPRTNTDSSNRPLSLVSSISPITSRQTQSTALDRLVESTPSSRNPSTANSPTLSHHPHDRGESQSSPLRSASTTLVHQPGPASAAAAAAVAADTSSQVIENDDDDDDVAASPGTTPPTKVKDYRPPTSESDRDHVSAISPDLHKTDRSDRPGSGRRGLHRTLRDSHGSFHSSHHHSPSLHRHKKGKSSVGSSGNDDSLKAGSADTSNELKRGAGSFILHGKKASVISMGTEWPALSHEDRLRMRTEGQLGEASGTGYDQDQDRADRAEQEQPRHASVQRDSITSMTTVVTAMEDEFVDARSIKDEPDSVDGTGTGTGTGTDAKPQRQSLARMSSSHYSSAQSSPFIFGPAEPHPFGDDDDEGSEEEEYEDEDEDEEAEMEAHAFHKKDEKGKHERDEKDEKN